MHKKSLLADPLVHSDWLEVSHHKFVSVQPYAWFTNKNAAFRLHFHPAYFENHPWLPIVLAMISRCSMRFLLLAESIQPLRRLKLADGAAQPTKWPGWSGLMKTDDTIVSRIIESGVGSPVVNRWEARYKDRADGLYDRGQGFHWKKASRDKVTSNTCIITMLGPSVWKTFNLHWATCHPVTLRVSGIIFGETWVEKRRYNCWRSLLNQCSCPLGPSS